MKVIFIKGRDIYKAALAGAKRGYNRSTDDYSTYERALKGCYDYQLSTVDEPSVRLNLAQNTGRLAQCLFASVFSHGAQAYRWRTLRSACSHCRAQRHDEGHGCAHGQMAQP